MAELIIAAPSDNNRCQLYLFWSIRSVGTWPTDLFNQNKYAYFYSITCGNAKVKKKQFQTGSLSYANDLWIIINLVDNQKKYSISSEM